MKHVLTFVLISVAFTGCQLFYCGCGFVDIHVDIKYVNKAGTSILNQPNGIAEDDITILIKENDQWKEYHEPNLDASNGYSIYERDSAYVLRLLAEGEVTGGLSEVIIQYEGFEADTIVREIGQSDKSMWLDNIWVNDSLVIPSDANGHIVQLTK